MRRVRLIGSVLAVAGSLSLVPASWALPQGAPAAAVRAVESAEWKTVENHWYVMEINGAKAGWMNAMIETDGERFRTRSDTMLKIGRVGAQTEVAMTTTFLETKDFKPLVMESRSKMSTQAVDQKWEFLDGKVLFTSTQGGRESKQELPLPAGGWLTPMATDDYLKKQRAAGAQEITFKVLDPQSGLKPVETTSRRTGASEVEIDGKQVKVTEWTTRTSVMPIDAIEKIDANDDMVCQEIPAGFGKMVLRLSTEAQAKAEGAAAGPELMTKTFVKPDKPVENAYESTSAKLTLTMKSGKMPELISAGAQRVEPDKDGKSAHLTIDIDANQPASAADIADKQYTASTTMVDTTDPLVKSLAEKAVADAGDDLMSKAEACRAFVNKYISKKGLSTAFATASETAKNRTGDCSEHGVLLAALLRANGIPSRVTTGLLYVNEFGGEQGIFGWHMWTQALIDGKWVDFDAVLPNRYNALHILTGVSSLDSGLGAEDMSSAILLIGNIDVRVDEVGYAKKGGKDDARKQ